MVALEAFAGHNVFDNFVRLFVIGTAIALALVAGKIGYAAMRRRGEAERVFGVLSFMCFCLTPAINGLIRFGQPVNWWSTSVYLSGLVFGGVAVYFRVTVSPPWLLFGDRVRRVNRVEDGREDRKVAATRGREDKARDRGHEQEDREREGARGREDEALSDDRAREDHVTEEYRQAIDVTVAVRLREDTDLAEKRQERDGDTP